MSLKKIEQVKADKGFKLSDLFVYAAIVTLVVVLFIVIFATRDDSPLKGIRIYVKNEIVYEYDFGDGQRMLNGNYTEVISNDEKTVVLKINTGGNDYNIVHIDKEGSVKVTEANCGKNDCVYTPELKNSGGVIYCSPHRMKIVPFDYALDDGNIII